jgi:hypothetical protein
MSVDFTSDFNGSAYPPTAEEFVAGARKKQSGPIEKFGTPA